MVKLMMSEPSGEIPNFSDICEAVSRDMSSRNEARAKFGFMFGAVIGSLHGIASGSTAPAIGAAIGAAHGFAAAAKYSSRK